MHKFFTTLSVCFLAILISHAQQNEQELTTTKKIHTWEPHVEGRMKFRFGFDGLPQPIFQFTGDGVIPLKLGSKVPRYAMLVTTRLGYHQPYSFTTGIGGCIGKQNLWIAPQIAIALGSQNGLGAGLTAQAKSRFLKIYYESSFIVDYYRKNDSWFSTAEFVISPKIRESRPLNIGIEIEDRVAFERENDITYSKLDNELELSLYLHYFPHQLIFVGCGFGTAPIEIHEKSFLKSSYVSFCFGFRFEGKHNESHH